MPMGKGRWFGAYAGAGESGKEKEKEERRWSRRPFVRAGGCTAFPLFTRWGRRGRGRGTAADADADGDVIEEVDEREVENETVREMEMVGETPRSVVRGRARLSKLVYGVRSLEDEALWRDDAVGGGSDGSGSGEGSAVRRGML